MPLSHLNHTIDRVSKMVLTTVRLLTGLQLLGVVGLVSYFSFKDELTSGMGNALLAGLILGQMVGILIAQWLTHQQQTVSAERYEAEVALHQSEAKFICNTTGYHQLCPNLMHNELGTAVFE